MNEDEKDERCAASFFELIDIDGEDDVFEDLNKKTLSLLNNAVNYMLGLSTYDIKSNHCKENPHLKVDLKHYSEKVLADCSKVKHDDDD